MSRGEEKGDYLVMSSGRASSTGAAPFSHSIVSQSLVLAVTSLAKIAI